MLCYRDMTFCPFYEECKKGYDCSRALTEKVEAHARAVGLPVAQFINPPECYEAISCGESGCRL